MANLGQSYNTSDIPKDESFSLIPDGWYEVSINSADLRDTKAGTGQYVALRYDILGPSHEGRVVFGNLNIRNPNAVAQEVGIKQLGEIMRAIGLSSVEDTEQLMGGHLEIKVKTSPAKGGYDASNDHNGFRAIKGGSVPMPPSNPDAFAEADSSTGASSPPWSKK